MVMAQDYGMEFGDDTGDRWDWVMMFGYVLETLVERTMAGTVIEVVGV